MRPHRPVILLLSLLCGFLSACAGNDHRILGTDLPLVPGTTLTENTLVVRGGRASSGAVTFDGSIFDALERARWTGRGFEKDGWTEASITGTPEAATGVWTQRLPGGERERVATLEITASQVRGVAVITVTDRAVEAKPDS